MKPPTLTEQDATTKGFRALTTAYSDAERWMRDIVVNDMMRGGFAVAFVRYATGIEIWCKAKSPTKKTK